MSTSRTTARCGCSNTSAFTPVHSSLVDQHLDLVGRTGREFCKGLRCLIQSNRACDDTLDGQVAGGDLGCDPVEVVDPVAPRTDDGEVVQRPEHWLDDSLAHK